MFKRLWKGLFHPSPRGRVRFALFFVVILGILAGIFVYPQGWNSSVDKVDGLIEPVPGLRQVDRLKVPQRPFQMGLDLAGGAHLVYEADLSKIAPSERDQAMDGVRDVIERRVNAFGISEPVVQTARTGEAWRLVVELAGVFDINEAIRLIGETPVLEFKEESTPEPQRELTPEEKFELEQYNKAARARVDEVLKRIENDATIDFMELAKEYSEDTASRNLGGALGYVGRDGVYGELWRWADSAGVGKISLASIETAEGWNIIQVSDRKEEGSEIHAAHLLICYRGVDRCEMDISKEEVKARIEEIRAQATPENFAELARQHSTEPGAAESSGDLGWFGKGMMVKPFEDAVFALTVGTISQVVETQFGFHLIHKLEDRPAVSYHINRILIRQKTPADYLPAPEPWRATELSGKHLKRSQLQFDQSTGVPQVGLVFNSEGAQLFAEITRRNVDRFVAIFLDGVPISIPRVQAPIINGEAVITGNFTAPEAKLLAQRLNAGALPVPVALVSQQTVGATLGKVSVAASLKAGIIGFIAVAVFMILFYRLAGVVAVLALGMYAALVLAIFKLIPVTLTLAGIAGFILSVGIAVDANVLIFERIKEELRRGKDIVPAIEDGFRRAWPSIRDSNNTTLFGALIFFWFSTSLVKGFGLTLSLGVVVSMFSALWVTRVILRILAPYVKNPVWYGTRVRRSVANLPMSPRNNETTNTFS